MSILTNMSLLGPEINLNVQDFQEGVEKIPKGAPPILEKKLY